MSTTLIDLLVIFAGIATAALLLQVVLIIGVARRVATLSASATPVLEELRSKLPDFMRESAAVLSEARAVVRDTRSRLDALAGNIVEITGMARGQVERVDEFLNDLRERVQSQVERADEALTGVMEGFEGISLAVQRTIIKPVNDLNALFRGFRAGIDFFFRRRSSPVQTRPVYEDEEMFI